MATKPVLVDDSTSYTKPVTPNPTPTQPSNGNITTMSTKPSQVNIGGVMMDVDAVKSKLGNVLTGAINASTPTNTTASSAPGNPISTQPNPQPTAPSAPDFNGMLQNQANAQFSQQQAMLGKARDEQIAQLQKAYADAVAEGTISVRDAEEAFRKQSEVINQQAYQNSQATNLSAESRGIGNSQQMLGLMQGDNARKNSMINENMTTRDKRVSDIQDRIKSLTTKRDLDIAGANANYNYGLASAKGQIDANMFGKMFDVQHEEYTANRNNQFDLNKMDKQQANVLAQMAQQYGYDINKMDKQQLYTLDQMARSQGYDLEKLSVQQGYTQTNMQTQQNFDLQKMSVQQKNVLTQMAKQQGYDLDKMSQAQVNDLAKMAKQHGYNMTMQNDAQSHDASMQANQQAFNLKAMEKQHGFDMSKIDAQSQKELKSIEARAIAEANAVSKEYETAMGRELAKYQPGTQEYKIMQSQLNQQKQQAMDEIHTRATLDANAKFALTLETTAPSPPEKNWLGNVTKAKQKEYDAKLASYYRYLDWQDNGQFDNSTQSGLNGKTNLK